MKDFIRQHTEKLGGTWPGISSAYCYIGSIASIFSWHIEDINFNSITKSDSKTEQPFIRNIANNKIKIITNKMK